MNEKHASSNFSNDRLSKVKCLCNANYNINFDGSKSNRKSDYINKKCEMSAAFNLISSAIWIRILPDFS